MQGSGGVGHVNVPGKLHTCSMLRSARVGVGWGMLTFLVSCTHARCYAVQGSGGVGHVNVPGKLHICSMLRSARVGVGWGM